MRRVFRLSDTFKEMVLLAWLWLPLGLLRRPQRTAPVIASLTSYPPRLGKCWVAIETLLRQTVKPERLILVLNIEEFPDKSIPARIEKQTKRGLEILWVERNGRSHDKLIPVKRKYPTATIVTFDDDKYFPPYLLSKLLEASSMHPGCVVAARGWVIRRNGPNEELHFGLGWTRAEPGSLGTNLFTPGGNGCLYPPNSLDSSVDDLDSALDVCPDADDIWFWGAIQKAKTSIFCLGLAAHRPVSTLRYGPALSSIDPVLEDCQFQRALNHFGIRAYVLEASLPVDSNG